MCCKKQRDDSVDSIRYFEITSKAKALQTREEACKKKPGQTFINERCVVEGVDQATCEDMKFYTWKNETCYFDASALEDKTKERCASQGKVMQDGTCVRPESQ